MKKTFKPILICLTLLALIFGAPGAHPVAASADPLQVQKTSPNELLNADGTLNLDGAFHGTLDLAGWNVQIDPQRGPIFAPSSLAAPGQWANLGVGTDGPLMNEVRAIAVNGTDVYVGGIFENVINNGMVLTAADKIVKWDGSNWSALGSNGAGDGSIADAGVNAIAISGTDVYVGGDFRNVNNNGTVLTAADSIAKWDGTNWSALGSDGAGNGSLNHEVYAIAVSGTNVYVGGNFTDVNNHGVVLPAADYIAKWNGSTWSALGSNGAGDGAINGRVLAIAISGTDVYVGGGFKDVNNNGAVLPTADFIAKWNGSKWSALGSNGAGNGALNGRVSAVAISGTNLYVGGSFTNVNNNGIVLPAADYIAKWNGSAWSALGSNGAGDGAIARNEAFIDGVSAIAVSGTTIYVSGPFQDVNNNGTVLTAADYIARWNGSAWSALGSNGAGDGAVDYLVSALAVSETNLYIGGRFDKVTNKGTVFPTASNIAQWNGSDWSALGSSGRVNGSLDCNVTAIAISGTDVYVGGCFTDVNNNGTVLTAADYIAKWNGSSWSALGSNGHRNGSLNARVSAIAIGGTDVYVGGNFTDVNNKGTVLPAADWIAKWNGSNWSALGSNGAGNGSLNSGVSTIAVSGTIVYVGGGFTDVNNRGKILKTADYIARWNGSDWSALGSNGAGDGSLNYYVYTIAISGANVYVGGQFKDVNNKGTVLTAADCIAKWNGSNWSALGSNGAGDGSIHGRVNAVAISGTDVYVGGEFRNVNNNGHILGTADYIAKWDGTSWAALGSGAGNGSLNNQVFAIAVSGADVYVSGLFTDVNNNGTVLPTADWIAKWNGNSWSALGSNGIGNGSLSYHVGAIAATGTDLYVGGGFTNVNNNGIVLPAADYMAAYGLGTVPSATPTPTQTIGASPTQTVTATLTQTSPMTPTITVTPTQTPSPSSTGTMTETQTPTETPMETATPTP